MTTYVTQNTSRRVYAWFRCRRYCRGKLCCFRSRRAVRAASHEVSSSVIMLAVTATVRVHLPAIREIHSVAAHDVFHFALLETIHTDE